MRLTPAQSTQFWAQFNNSPLFAKWPTARDNLYAMLELMPIPPDGVIYEPGDPPSYLYLIGAGSVQLSLLHNGKPYLQQELGPGDHFGQMGLFANKYRSRAVATPETVLYRMSAAGLRTALDQNPALQEELLHEKRAGRLRRIPLLHSMTDDQLRWLAQVIEERTVARGEKLPLGSDAGLWIVDYGQIKVTGPANPHEENEWPKWGITAGNFFFSPGPDLQFGRKCIAETAVAAAPGRLYYLPVRAANRLIATFPEMGNRVAEPLDIAQILSTIPQFQLLTHQQQEHLAQYAGWEFVPAGQNVTTQGSVGHSFVYIFDGAAVVTAVDDRGRSRPRTYFKAGDAYGTTSLLAGQPRDATVRAVRAQDKERQPGLDGAEVIILNRDDVQHAFAVDRQMWHRGVPLVNEMVVIKEDRRPLDWMDEGEVLRWRKNPHILWLILPGALVVLAAVLLVIVWRAVPDAIKGTVGVAALICGGPLLVLAFLIVFLNYQDDYYALTNRRVTRRDRQLMLYEARAEAPLEMVQDVTINTNFWGRLFGYGNVTVRTASKDRWIVLNNISQPENVKADILQGRIEAQAAGYGKQNEILRRNLMSNLQLALPVPERQRALGDAASPPQSMSRKLFSRGPQTPQPSQEKLPGAPRPPSRWLVWLNSKLPEQWRKVIIDPTKLQTRPLSGQVVWRKHWLNLAARAGLPFFAFFLVIVLGVILLFTRPSLPGFPTLGLFPLWFVALIASGIWLWWQYTDWHNDIYVLTDDKIIDIEQRPLGLDTKRREGGLERVQNVNAKQSGILSNIFDYGDVIISTAAGDEGYTFIMVAHPKKVQATVFQKLDQLRRRQEEKHTLQRQREMIEGLQVYHQIQAEQASRDNY